MAIAEKYADRLDAQIITFIEESEECFPEGGVPYSIRELRKFYKNLCEHFYAGRPDEVKTRDLAIDVAGHETMLRHYVNEGTEPIAALIYAHGGGFIFGDLDSHDDVCAEICHRANVEVWSVDYRLSPEHKHPAAFDDVMAAFDCVFEASNLPIITAGDSAGATLVASLAHAKKCDVHKPLGQLLIYPSLGGPMDGGTFVEFKDAPLLNSEEVSFYTRVRQGKRNVENDVTYAPLSDDDYSDIPPTITLVAEFDPLRDDGVIYHDRLCAAGAKSELYVEEGLVHGYLRARHVSDRAKESFSRILAGIIQLAENASNS